MSRAYLTITRREAIRTAWLVGSGAVLGVATLPAITSSSPSARALQAAADPTKTREAELAELNALRTQVAKPDDCASPSAASVTPTAIPTQVPPAAVGVTIEYAHLFDITVLGIAPLPIGGGLESQGQLLQVNLTILNTTRDAELPPFRSWLLIDASGLAYRVDPDASREIGGVGWELTVAPGESADRAIVFDVLPNAGTTFTLESRKEPNFRVALAIESRG